MSRMSEGARRVRGSSWQSCKTEMEWMDGRAEVDVDVGKKGAIIIIKPAGVQMDTALHRTS